jgi:hypothetical protein
MQSQVYLFPLTFGIAQRGRVWPSSCRFHGYILMRRGRLRLFERHCEPSRTVVPNLPHLGLVRQLCLIHSYPIKQYLPQSGLTWQQRRSYAEQTTNLIRFPQASDPSFQKDLDLKYPDEGFKDLLSEAARYSIRDVDSLDFESSVTSDRGRITRLVEKARFQFDYDLWAILLRYRIRAYGDTGIKTIWKYLTRRGRIKLLPFHWPQEDSFWRVFIALGLRDHEFLGSLAEHARQLWAQRQMRRESLYVEVVGGLLRSDNAAAAPTFSARMHPGVPISPAELLELFFQARSSTHPAALENFCHICDTVPNHKLYGMIIPTLCAEGRGDEAMAMHNYLFRRYDCPSTFEAIEPLVRHIAQGGLEISVFIRQLEKACLSFSGRVQRHYDSIKVHDFGVSREDIDLATNRTFGVKRSKISDAFAARFFATKSFSFGFAFNGLRMLGLDELGPLSLREIALQSGTATVMCRRLNIIDSMKIDTGGSAYSRVIRKLVQERKHSLLMDVVLCDQHSDVFEDQQFQLQLLDRYYHLKDWRQVNRTLAILSIWGDSKQHSLNALLRCALIRKDWPEVMKIAAQMHQSPDQISQANIILMYNLILYPRRASHRVSLRAHGFESLKFLIMLWQSSLNSGASIPVKVWREPLRRLGMMGKWIELEKICLWLCSWYTPQDEQSATKNSFAILSVLPLKPVGEKHAHGSSVGDIFSPKLQRAIIEWGFMAGLKRRKISQRHEETLSTKNGVLRQAPWVCGIKLLCSLRSRYGVQLHDATVQMACEERLRQLFSWGGRSKLRHNREARRMNRVKLHVYLFWINKAYGQILIDPHDGRTLSKIRANRRLKPRETAKSLRSLSKRITKWQKDASSQAVVSEVEEDAREGDIVMYRDLFHASWEDYQSRPQINKN